MSPKPGTVASAESGCSPSQPSRVAAGVAFPAAPWPVVLIVPRERTDRVESGPRRPQERMADEYYNGGAQPSAAADRASHAHAGQFEACSPDPVVFLEFLARLPTAELVQLQQQARDMLPSMLAKEAQEKTLLVEASAAAAILPSDQDAPAKLPTETLLFAPDASGHKEDTGNGSLTETTNGKTRKPSFPGTLDRTESGMNMRLKDARAKLFLSAAGLPPKDKNLVYGATSDPYLILLQGGKEVGRTCTMYHTLCPKWDRFSVKLNPNQEVVLECWDYDKLTEDDLMGSATVAVDEILRPGAKIQLQNSRKSSGCGVITVNSVNCQMQCTERCSIVNMMQERVYVLEGENQTAHFHVFRVHNLDQRVCVTWKTRCVSCLQELVLSLTYCALTLHTARTSQTLLGL